MKKYFCFSKLIILFAIVITWNLASGGIIERKNNLNSFGIGARAIGLSNAYTAACNDYTTPVWNPAAMAFFTTTKLGGMQSKMSLHREMTYLSFALPTSHYGTFALSWAGFGVHDIEARTSNSIEPDSYFSSVERTYFLSYANVLLPNFSIGGNIKVLDFGIQNIHAIGMAADLAFFFVPWDRIRFGFVAQDLASLLSWSSEYQEVISKTYRIGACVVPSQQITFSCDYQQIDGRKGKFSFATEVLTFNLIKLRCGFEKQKWALGSGFTLPIKNTYVTFNYAISTDQLNAGIFDVFDLSVVF